MHAYCEGNYNIIRGPATADAATKQLEEINKGVIFINIDCSSEISNTQVHNAKDLRIAMPMYTLRNMVIIIQKHLKVYSNITETGCVILLCYSKF